MKLRIVYLVTSCQRCGPMNQTLSIIKNLNPVQFDIILVSLYPERRIGSMLQDYLPYVRHIYVPINKIKIILGCIGNLRNVLISLCPDVVHSVGVFPAFAYSHIGCFAHIMTIRCDMWEDYIPGFGVIKGNILILLHQYAMRHAKVITCSESLAKIYQGKLGQSYEVIRNDVDLEQYSLINNIEKRALRQRLALPINGVIYIYAARMHSRKNQSFLLQTFCERIANDNAFLLLLGDGMDYEYLFQKFGRNMNVIFRGQVSNVREYLQACDIYVSTSKAEGMPNGVLEAMACGLPVILSDIPQHMEILNLDESIGASYHQGNSEDLADIMRRMMVADYVSMGKRACRLAHEEFDAKKMSKRYQSAYFEMTRKVGYKA